MLRPLVVAVSLNVHDDPGLDAFDLYNESAEPTFHIRDAPSVRVFVQGPRDCTKEASEELFFPNHSSEQNVTVVLYNGLLQLAQTLHIQTSTSITILAAPFEFPQGAAAAYRQRLEDGNATATWTNGATQHGNFAVGFSLDGGASRAGAFGNNPANGPGHAETTLGYEGSRAARNATTVAATVTSDGPVVAPGGMDVQLHATLYFLGHGRQIADGTAYGPHRSCIESP